MHKINAIALTLAVGALAFISCTREFYAEGGKKEEEKEDHKTVHIVFNASSSSENDRTKATIDSCYVKWTAGDAISVFDGGGKNCQFALTAGGGSNSGRFEGEVTTVQDKYRALFPYTPEATYNGTVITSVRVPDAQTVPDGLYSDPKATVMVAYGDSSDLNFQNVLSYIKIVPTEDCGRIIIRCKKGECLAGKGDITFAADTFSFKINGTVSEDSCNTIWMSGNFKAGTSYYAAVIPGTYHDTLSLEFYGRKSTLDKERSGDYTLVRGRIHSAAGGETHLRYSNWSVGIPANADDYVNSWSAAYRDWVGGIKVEVNCSGPSTDSPQYLDTRKKIWSETEWSDEYGTTVLFIRTYQDDIKIFGDCPALFRGFPGIYFIYDIWRLHIEGSTSFDSFFKGCNNLGEINVSSFDGSNVKNLSSMFGDCWNLRSIYGFQFWYKPHPTTMDWMFTGCALDSLDLSSFYASELKDCNHMLTGNKPMKKLTLSDNFQLPAGVVKTDMMNRIGFWEDPPIIPTSAVIYGITLQSVKDSLMTNDTGWEAGGYWSFSE